MTASIETAVLLTGTTIVVAALIVFEIARAARRAGVSLWIASFAGGLITAWLVGVAGLSHAGVLSQWAAFPPRWPLLPIAALLIIALCALSRRFRQIATHVVAWEPVALQVFRVLVELVFWRLYIEGTAPIQITFEGRNYDILVGLSAPLVAAGIAAGWIGKRTTVAWNIFGLTLLINAVWTVATSVPGKFHLDWAGEPFTAIVTWPVIWIPAFLVPIAIFLHILSIRQASSFHCR